MRLSWLAVLALSGCLQSAPSTEGSGWAPAQHGIIELPDSTPCPADGCDAVVVNVTGIPTFGSHSEVVIFDPASRPTEPLYRANQTIHPDFYNVHDALADWGAKNDVAIRFIFAAEFAVASIDGVSGNWTWTADGAPDGGSISLTPAQGLGEITWVIE